MTHSAPQSRQSPRQAAPEDPGGVTANPHIWERTPRPEGTCPGQWPSLSLALGPSQAPTPADTATQALLVARAPPALSGPLLTPTGPGSSALTRGHRDGVLAWAAAHSWATLGIRWGPGPFQASTPVQPDQQQGPRHGSGWAECGPQAGTGAGWERSPDEKGQINCLPG